MNLMHFVVQTAQGAVDLDIPIRQLVIAGWTGRDTEAMEHHIRELEALGVKRPAATPMFYRVSSDRLTTQAHIEASGRTSSGEVEFLLVRSGGQTYVGVASDHTDREVETYGVTVSKQMCEKPCATVLWRLEDIEPHWDRLVLRSYANIGGEKVLYQQGPVTTMRAPSDLLARFADAGGRFEDGTAMLCGTLAAIGGIRSAERFDFELEDPVLGRRLQHGYGITPLPVLG
ncbi:DUF2848 domain-containing protein [Pandoraea pnomenusa]|uniref:DUF2848 domain-containing protein n=1 Tax=Pandoraea pnomenusa TaxID=93220 RepID=UPI003CF95738